jgi:hypothetical protein
MASQAQVEAVPFAYAGDLRRRPEAKPVHAARPRFWQSTRFLKQTRRVVRALRSALGAITLIVPFVYFCQAAIDAGVFRAQAFATIHATGFMDALVTPGRAVGEALFAIGVVRDGWNLWLLAVALISLFLRKQLLKPLDALEQWLRSKYAKQEIPHLPHALRYVVPQVNNPNRLGRA